MVLEESASFLEEAVVTSVKRMNSEIAIVQATRSAGVVMSGCIGQDRLPNHRTEMPPR
jgi:hypothetical protein